MRIGSIAAVVLSLASACIGSGAIAQGTSGNGALHDLSSCRQISAPDARLACFDKTAAALDAAVAAKDVQIVDRQDIRKARKSLFGFSIPHIPLFGGGERDSDADREAFAQLDTTIVSTRPASNNRIELRLAESDAVWVTTDPVPFPPKPGTKVRIRQGAMGNYFIAIAGAKSVRGMRIR